MNKLDLEKDIATGMSSHQLAKKYSKSQTTIRYWLKKFGLKTQFKQIGKGYVPDNVVKFIHSGSAYEKIDWPEYQMMINNGKVWRDLIEHGLSNNAISWAVNNDKIQFRKDSNKLAHKNGKYDYSVYRTPEFRKKMSKYGGYKPNAGRCSHLKYTMKDGSVVDLQGSWELKLAQFLDQQNVRWERNRVGYKYSYEDKDRQYFPDFRLLDLDVYIEVKGYETEKDKAKWQQFPFKLIILKKEEINNLTTWWNNFKQKNQ